ncbi:hypothetical protein QYF36_026198 [Acer negundo]|nr:hypothetical protein QYF36_026198 [Acer negundo]
MERRAENDGYVDSNHHHYIYEIDEQDEIMNKPSFVEVTTRNRWVTEKRGEEESRNWTKLVVNRNSSDLRWLKRSVIECESKGFIRNNLFCDDAFNRMEKWSENLENQRKPSWVNITDFKWVGELLDLNFETAFDELDVRQMRRGVVGSSLSQSFRSNSESDRSQGWDFDRAEKRVVEKWILKEKRKESREPFPTKEVGKLFRRSRGDRDKQSRDLGYSSSDTESRESDKEYMSIHNGKCSKTKIMRGKTISDRKKDGPIIQNPIDGEFSSSSESPNELIIITESCEDGVFSDPLEGPSKMIIVGKDLEPLNLEVELVSDVSKIVDPNKTNEKGNKSKKDIIEKQSQLSNEFYWNIEEEIAKVIEKKVSLGYVFKLKDQNENQKDQSNYKNNQGASQENYWNLDNKVAKVIEVGVALGFDFNRNEVEIGENIVSKEKEDEAVMAAVNDS